ncbi:hypothetical protein [Bacillus sp. HSf4]|nr:hypothetical protein [Bacillus sp. HSf4]WFA06007.1 hypothetical protein P3X63_04105 [Bacillus sp. HSf4]
MPVVYDSVVARGRRIHGVAAAIGMSRGGRYSSKSLIAKRKYRT